MPADDRRAALFKLVDEMRAEQPAQVLNRAYCLIAPGRLKDWADRLAALSRSSAAESTEMKESMRDGELPKSSEMTSVPRHPSAMFRKKPVVIEATQWFTNGDHPADGNEVFPERETLGKPFTVHLAYIGEYAGECLEGKVVRYYRHPNDFGERLCDHCHIRMHEHGWIDTKEGGHIVCPGDWIITGVQGERYPCKPDIFTATYELVSPAPASAVAVPSARECICSDCGAALNDGEAKCFTVCDVCWDKHYPTKAAPAPPADLRPWVRHKQNCEQFTCVCGARFTYSSSGHRNCTKRERKPCTCGLQAALDRGDAK